MNEEEAKEVHDHVGVLVQKPRLNHKQFQIRINVKSEGVKSVLVKFFLAPKYDSHGYEIPLHLNTQNFMQLDELVYDLPEGESVIIRDSVANTGRDWASAKQVYETVEKAVHSKGQLYTEKTEGMAKMAQHLLLPKGRVGVMPFVLMVYISEYRAPKVAFNAASDITLSLGLPPIVRQLTDEPFGFPVNRPLYAWQVEDVKKLYFQDVLIHHKHTPEIEVLHME